MKNTDNHSKRKVSQSAAAFAWQQYADELEVEVVRLRQQLDDAQRAAARAQRRLTVAVQFNRTLIAAVVFLTVAMVVS